MVRGRGQRRRTLRPWAVGLVVAAAALALGYAPGWLPGSGAPGRVDPAFPSTIAPYSWYTGTLSDDRLDAATLLYQNGVGVELMDVPQAVLLSTDGSTYRRLDAAEAASIPEDQGDPAVSVLAPDGTFAVVGSAGRTGEVQVVTLRDGERRRVPVGGGRTALPVSIGADGRTVLLTTSEEVVHRYADEGDLGLARLDLRTGRLHDLPGVRGVRAAALSPDGSRIIATTRRGVQLLDATTGTVTATVRVSGSPWLDGDAWSPDGRLVALVDGSVLAVVDVSGPRPVERQLPLGGVEHGVAIGWRDASTVLVHGTTDAHANTSELFWVDTTTGGQVSFASYAPNFTGAALLRADAARDLVGRWRVDDRPVDRGPLPLRLGLLLAATAGLVAGATTRCWTRARAPHPS